jgi:MoxR-like ATPase
MEERQITIDGETFPMEPPYMVMATQNPIESYGTFPLPEAQLDRFFMRMSLGYMSREEEIRVLSRPDSKQLLSELEPVVGVDELIDLQKAYPDVQVKEDVAGYIMDLVSYTRNSELLNVGVSTRGALALYRASQIYAAVNGRDYVIPEDVKTESSYVLPHRLMMTSRSHMDVQNFIRLMLDDVSVPLEKL